MIPPCQVKTEVSECRARLEEVHVLRAIHARRHDCQEEETWLRKRTSSIQSGNDTPADSKQLDGLVQPVLRSLEHHELVNEVIECFASRACTAPGSCTASYPGRDSGSVDSLQCSQLVCLVPLHIFNVNLGSTVDRLSGKNTFPGVSSSSFTVARNPRPAIALQ